MRSNYRPDSPTLFAPDLVGKVVGDVLALDRSEAEHLRVLRCRPGISVQITDGRGTRWSAQLMDLDRRSAKVALGDSIPAAPALPVHLAVGIGNRARFLTLVEKATEFGVGGIQPLECERSRSVADAGRSPAFWSKARARAVAALKQSGGSWLPQIEAPQALDTFLASAKDGHTGQRFLLDAGGPLLAARLSVWPGAECLTVLVGPEGGLSDAERARCAEAGFLTASLSSRTLRFETAAIAALAVVSQMEGGT
ncbi:MAG: RsmE family RNA methyltransferase [Gemmatimonadota bacterium]